MCAIERRLHKGDRSESLTCRLLWVKPPWAAKGATDSHPKVICQPPSDLVLDDEASAGGILREIYDVIHWTKITLTLTLTLENPKIAIFCK